jgi:conserved oligomeric Golgi complex subunit 6
MQNLSARIHKEALSKIVKAYKLICEEVVQEKNRYEAGATLLGSVRPFGRVYLLRQIFGMEEEESESEGEEESEEEEESGEEEEESEEESDEGDSGEEPSPSKTSGAH